MPRGLPLPMAKSSPVSSCACAKMYAEQGGANPEQVLSMTWNYSTPHEPASEEVAMESNGKALADITDPATGAVIVKKGQQLSSFAQLRDDGTTSSGCWIFAGSWTPEGNQMARRDNADPSGLGNTLGWAWAWPLNRRILYNRASADPQGNPWDPKRQILKWDGAKWSRDGYSGLQCCRTWQQRRAVHHAAGRDGTPVCYR